MIFKYELKRKPLDLKHIKGNGIDRNIIDIFNAIAITNLTEVRNTEAEITNVSNRQGLVKNGLSTAGASCLILASALCTQSLAIHQQHNQLVEQSQAEKLQTEKLQTEKLQAEKLQTEQLANLVPATSGLLTSTLLVSKPDGAGENGLINSGLINSGLIELFESLGDLEVEFSTSSPTLSPLPSSLLLHRKHLVSPKREVAGVKKGKTVSLARAADLGIVPLSRSLSNSSESFNFGEGKIEGSENSRLLLQDQALQSQVGERVPESSSGMTDSVANDFVDNNSVNNNPVDNNSIVTESTSSSGAGVVDGILEQLENLPEQEFRIPIERGYLSSPALTISNPNGYGADQNIIFASASYQRRTRFTRTNDGELGLGVGLGNAVKLVGVELAYTINTFGTSSGGFGNLKGFGSGAFSIKVHRRISEDFAVAVGWNQFLRIERNPDVPLDYPENSYYVVATKVFKTRPYISQPFSRLAATVGIGSGQFLPFDKIQEAVANDEAPTGLNLFGSLSVRVLRPVSAILEWTGQDLGVGLSIVPFRNLPLVITPAIRDITGAGDGARFIMGAGVSIQL